MPSIIRDSLTMADVIRHLKNNNILSGTRRRDLRSAVTRLCDLVDRSPDHLRADMAELRRALATVHPAQAGISKKTLDNIQSNALSALRLVRDDLGTLNKQTPLSGEWQTLYNSLPGDRLYRGLSRFVRFCSGNSVSPANVCDATIDAFIAAVRRETFYKNPNELHRRTTRLWNEAADTVEGWPQVRLTVPEFRTPRRSIPLDQFTPQFQKDVEKHLNWLSGADLFCKNPPPKVCKPGTIRLRESNIGLAASAFIRQGHNIDDLNSLADLVTPDAAKAVLMDYLDRHNGEPSQFIRDLAKTLIQIAKHWVRIDADQMEGLKDLRKRLGSDRSGLTEKNRATLRQFDSDRNVLLFLELPDKLFAAARKAPIDDVRAAIKAQIALAVAILTIAPLRMHNLAALRLDKHIIRPGGPKGPVHIVIPANETKAGEPIEYALPVESAELLNTYIAGYRPRLCNDECPWLFPAKGTNKQKAQGTLSQQISEVVLKETGIIITPHQFRHVAAKLLLDENPGNFETVRQLLVHKSIKSTVGYYTGLQSANASKHYDKVLSEKRDRLANDNRNRNGNAKIRRKR
ncbi:MAG: site-specific integrase [Rhodospirillales bacterium]|jgi:integrase|nr:site-specific integrase [Rhodospirillales bacterium]